MNEIQSGFNKNIGLNTVYSCLYLQKNKDSGKIMEYAILKKNCKN